LWSEYRKLKSYPVNYQVTPILFFLGRQRHQAKIPRLRVSIMRDGVILLKNNQEKFIQILTPLLDESITTSSKE